LTADGRLRKVQLLARTSNASFASDDPEIEQMMVVEPVHETVQIEIIYDRRM